MGDDTRHIPALYDLRKLAQTTPALYGCLASYDAGGFTIEQALGVAVVMLAKQVGDLEQAFQSYAAKYPPQEDL